MSSKNNQNPRVYSGSINLFYLGPPGSYSQQAAKLAQQTYPELGQTELQSAPSPTAVADLLKAHPGHWAILPYANALEGLVQESLDQITLHQLQAVGAVRLPITLAAGSASGQWYPTVASHPKALAQCSQWVTANNLAPAELSSTAAACQAAQNEPILAIAHPSTLAAYQLTPIASDIANHPGHTNFTDFLILGSSKPAPTHTKSLVAISPPSDHPGLLQQILAQFSFSQINLVRLHSRPALRHTFANAQTFYLELDAHPQSESLQLTLSTLQAQFGQDAVQPLGSWTPLPALHPSRPLPEVEALSPCLILGAGGQFGKAFAEELSRVGIIVDGVDSQGHNPRCQYFVSDLSQLPQLSHYKWILFCTPPEVVAPLWEKLQTHLSPHCLISDIASTKTTLWETLKPQITSQTPWISLHPMFAPSVPFVHQNLCLTPFSQADFPNQPAYLALLSFLDQTQVHISQLSISEHDQLTSKLQAATHAALVAFGQLFSPEELPNAIKLSTPLNQILFGLLARIATTHQNQPTLYPALQTQNPFAAEARAQLIETLEHIQTDPETAFPAFLAAYSKQLPPQTLEKQTKYAQKLITLNQRAT